MYLIIKIKLKYYKIKLSLKNNIYYIWKNVKINMILFMIK